MKLLITVEGKTYEVDVEVLDKPTPSAANAPRLASSGGSSAAAAPSVPTPSAGDGDPKSILAPMAGSVTRVDVEVGGDVAVNQVLLVMEAMKMEVSVASPVEAKVKAIHCGVGDSVQANQLLVELE